MRNDLCTSLSVEGIQPTFEKAQVVYKLTSTAIAQQGISLAAKGEGRRRESKGETPPY
jgi:hypothetical protein